MSSGRHTAAYYRGYASRSAHTVIRDGCDPWGVPRRRIELQCDETLMKIAYLRDMCLHNEELQKVLAKAAAEIRREQRRHLRRNP